MRITEHGDCRGIAIEDYLDHAVWWCDAFDSLIRTVPKDTDSGRENCPWRSYAAHIPRVNEPDYLRCGWRVMVRP